MKNIARFAGTLLAALTTGLHAAPADTGTTYMIEAKILSIDAEKKIELQGDRMTYSTNGGWNMLMQAGKSADAWISKLEKQDGVDLLSAPKVVTRDGQEATIQISQALRYLEVVSNDLYRAVALPESENPGVFLTVTPTSGREPTKTAHVKLSLRSNLIEEMGELPGFPGHRLGKPVLSSRSIRTELEAPIDGWVVVGGNTLKRVEQDRSDVLVVVLRVSTP